MSITLEPQTSIYSDRLLDALRIYGESFPPHEQMSVAFWVETLREMPPGKEFLAVVDEAGLTVGMIFLEIAAGEADEGGESVAFLWYLCMRQQKRGQGLGAAAYAALLDHVFTAGIAAMVFEVEKPGEARKHGAAQEEFARRRMAWYRRNGAKHLSGLHYRQTTDNGQPPTPMHVMIHTPAPVTAEDAYALACLGLGEEIERDEALTLQ